jgi:hypothetical protein
MIQTMDSQSVEDDPLCALLRSKTNVSGLNLWLRDPSTHLGQNEDGIYGFTSYYTTTTTTIGRIAVACTPTPRSKVWIQRAIETHHTLEYLQVQVSRDDITPRGFLSDILRQVGLLPRLREFSYVGWYLHRGSYDVDGVLAVSSILTATSSLLSLQLREVKFTTESMEQFVHSLRSNQTLTTLDIEFCPLNCIVSQAFINLLCLSTNVHHLHELRYKGSNQALLVDSLAMTSLKDRLYTLSVGSGLQFLTLSFYETDDAHEFLRSYSAQAHRIRLKKLHLTTLRHHALDNLLECLPKLVYLKELKVLRVYYGSSLPTSRRLECVREEFARACKANGSLRVVFIDSVTRHDASEKTAKWIRSFGERNYLLPLRLSNSSNDGNECMPCRRANVTTTGSPTTNSDIAHFFAAATQSPRMAPNWILMGLVTSGDCIGPTSARSGKRSACSSINRSLMRC